MHIMWAYLNLIFATHSGELEKASSKTYTHLPLC